MHASRGGYSTGCDRAPDQPLNPSDPLRALERVQGRRVLQRGTPRSPPLHARGCPRSRALQGQRSSMRGGASIAVVAVMVFVVVVAASVVPSAIIMAAVAPVMVRYLYSR